MQWFEVDKVGLGKLLERKGKEFILYELVQNAWDENTKHVSVSLQREYKRQTYLLTVQDDNPDGFADLSHAFTIFAESSKKHDTQKRGRFNLGEKLVLALCEEASITSTKGSIIFNKKGRQRTNLTVSKGTVFTAKLKLEPDDEAAFEVAAHSLQPPKGITTIYNDRKIPSRDVVKAVDDVRLPTETTTPDGRLTRVTGTTTVEILNKNPGEQSTLYEMGIPVVEIDCRWHVNILQKVPLNMDRDNVTPAYLGRVRALVTEWMAEILSEEDANSVWVRDAVERHGDELSQSTVNKIVGLRFGEKRVAFDPSDPEANALAVTKGFTVVHGPQMSKAEWTAAKRVGAILPAGQVTPSPKPFHADGQPLKLLPEAKKTEGITRFIDFAVRLGKELLDCDVKVTVANDIGWRFNAAYGKGQLTVNVAALGYKWFDPLPHENAKVVQLLIHEFGHHYAGNHLSEEYHDALCNLGGRCTQLALTRPELFT